MSAVTHTVLLYQVPRQGHGFVGRHVASRYKLSIVAAGGFDKASWSANLGRAEAEYAFEHYLGCVVRVFVDNPMVPVWEGYIDRIRYRVGELVVTRGFENMANRVNVTYYNATSGAVVRTEQTAVAEHAASQAKYGVKEMSIQASPHYAIDVTHKEVIGDVISVVNGLPQASIGPAIPGDALISFEAKGLQYYVWDWTGYKSASTATDTPSTAVKRAAIRTDVAAGPNAANVYETASAAGSGHWDALIAENAAFNMPRGSSGGMTVLEYLRSIVEAGDGVNRWVFGITPVDYNTNSRRVYYKSATTDVIYTTRALGDAGRVRDIYGQLVPGYRVRPDAGIRINDILTGWRGGADDPRVNYIEQVKYDGTTGRVSWQSGDNVDIDGEDGLDKLFKPAKSRSKRGSPLRLAV
jgi:hypothetical protein